MSVFAVGTGALGSEGWKGFGWAKVIVEMGCSGSRDENPQETTLCTAQGRLGFSKCKAADVISAFQTWSVGQFVLHKHWLAIAHKLEISVTSPEAVRFYSLFHVPAPADLLSHVDSLNPGLGSGFVDPSEPVYDKKRLMMLGVLLADGTNFEKGKAIYEAFDEKCDGAFHDVHLKVMLKEMFLLAIEALPTLLHTDEQSPEMTHYLTQAKAHIESAVDAAVVLVLDKRRFVSAAQFGDKLEEYQGSDLCSPTGLRKRAHAFAPPAS